MSILKLLDRPIAYHRCFVRVGGSIGAAVFLSQAFYWQSRTTLDGGWFFKTMEDWESETGLTRREQETARKNLKETGVLEDKLAGIPAVLHYRINLTKLQESLDKTGLQTSLAESAKQACTFPTNKLGGKRQTISTETTSESTSENTGRIAFLKKELCLMFRRKSADPWTYAEETALVDINKRPCVLSEIEELKDYQRRDGKYFAQSLGKLMDYWNDWLDKARRPDFSKDEWNPPPGG